VWKDLYWLCVKVYSVWQVYESTILVVSLPALCDECEKGLILVVWQSVWKHYIGCVAACPVWEVCESTYQCFQFYNFTGFYRSSDILFCCINCCDRVARIHLERRCWSVPRPNLTGLSLVRKRSLKGPSIADFSLHSSPLNSTTGWSEWGKKLNLNAWKNLKHIYR